MKKLKVLFACVENSFRSQMSEGIARKYFSDRIDAYSAGSKPSGTVHPNAVKVLKEIGIDPSEQYSKGFTDLEETEFDYLVTMGCGEVCPFVPSRKQLNWELPDIKNNPLEDIRELRDLIKDKIEEEILEDTHEE